MERLYKHYHLQSTRDPEEMLARLCRLFYHLPYENFTKILKREETGELYPFRMPEEVVEDHLRWRAGGTCFSLTWALKTLLEKEGVETHPFTADMKAGKDIHSGLIYKQGCKSYLVDPGYLLTEPLSIPEKGKRSYLLGGRRIDLWRPNQENLQVYVDGRYRYTAHLNIPIDRFFQAWQASFPRLKELVAVKQQGVERIYLRGNFFRITRGQAKQQGHLEEDFPQQVAVLFNMDPQLIQKVLRVLGGWRIQKPR